MSNKAKGDKYEKYICEYLNDHYKNAYLWNDVPEQLLYETNLITNYNEHRLKRKKNNKINPLQACPSLTWYAIFLNLFCGLYASLVISSTI